MAYRKNQAIVLSVLRSSFLSDRRMRRFTQVDMLFRVLLYASLGLVLVFANLWFIRSIKNTIATPAFVIQPFVVIGPEGKELSDKVGLALARMTVARLAMVQTTLGEPVDNAAKPKNSSTKSESPFTVTRLFVQRPVHIPTSLVEPVEIQATVAGVELGGVFALFNRFTQSGRGIRFTIYQHGERAAISGDLSNFSEKTRYLWIQSSLNPDEIATRIAYALVWLKLQESGSGRATGMDLEDFQALLEIIAQVDKLNKLAASGYVVEKDFLQLLPKVEDQARESPTWPEMLYLAGSIADGAANQEKASSYYKALLSIDVATRKDANKEIFAMARKRVKQFNPSGIASAQSSDEQLAFILAASEFARRMSLAGADPKIVFKPLEPKEIQAIWNTDSEQYEVNTVARQIDGLPQYVALSGRFLQHNFDRCFTDKEQEKQPTVEFWNAFRFSVVDFLIQSEPSFENVRTVSQSFPLFKALKRIEELGGRPGAQRLALDLLERFECDWSMKSLPDIMLRINRERGLMNEAIIRKAAQELVTQEG